MHCYFSQFIANIVDRQITATGWNTVLLWRELSVIKLFYLIGICNSFGGSQRIFGNIYGTNLSILLVNIKVNVLKNRKFICNFQISGDDEFNLMVWWTTAYTFLIYWGFGLIYTVMDLTNKPKFLRRYKIQANTNEPVDTRKLIKVICSVLFNQIFVGIPFAIFSFYAMKLRGMPDVRELPTFHWVLFEIGICILVEEFGFYYSHRLMHNKKIYKHIHKQHHLWQAPVAVTAIYAHPIGMEIFEQNEFFQFNCSILF